MKYAAAFFLGATISLLIPSGPGVIDSGPSDAVADAFDKYETYYREAAKVTADKLDEGDLTSEADSQEFRSAANVEARHRAFDAIAKAESEALQDQWTPEKEAAILREYVQ